MRWARGFFGAFDATFLFGCWMWEAETGKGACCMLMNLGVLWILVADASLRKHRREYSEHWERLDARIEHVIRCVESEMHDRDAVLLVRCAAVRKGDVLECDIVTL